MRICWTFGDGKDTCIEYPTTYTGVYAVYHLYSQAGNYNVCVNIFYDGYCQSQSCHIIQVGEPDYCLADFEKLPVTASTNLLQATFNALPSHNHNKIPVRICWTFGDGRDTCIQYSNTNPDHYIVNHAYTTRGNYEVCVDILYEGGCEAKKCKTIPIGRPDSCLADFERLPVTTSNNPLTVVYKALPWHNNDRKPARICWNFGDGHDTCINYLNIYYGTYAVSHSYHEPGLYQVCVNILYYGGCEARKCEPVQVERMDSCRADFERIATSGTSPLRAYFRALPWHNDNKKPAKVCWSFGDGRDTCIEYELNYTGQYVVAHNYQQQGLYEVCVKILYFGGCEAPTCKPIQVSEPDSCSADFERIPVTTVNLLTAGFRALPWNNLQRKPARICWNFGDGHDTCIQYSEASTGPYTISHTYANAGEYQVCVSILYYGGCEARKCKPIIIQPVLQEGCTVRLFELTPSITSLVRGFLASVSSIPDRRPERICWAFGDGSDTCIMINPQEPLPDFIIHHTYPAPGVYRACVNIRFQGGCEAYDCIEVAIRNTSAICGGYMVDSLTGPRTFKFKGFGIHPPNDQVISYYWNFGDGSSSFGQEVTHTYNLGGDYEVCLYIKTQSGCETRICKTIRVPGNNEPALQLSPNPVINILHVQFFSTHTEQINIKIISANGVAVRYYTRNVTVGINNWEVDLNSLLPGIYSFVIQSPNQMASAVFIKQ